MVLVSGEDLTHYRAMSDKVTELLQSRFSPLVERLGMDENFIDVTQLVEARTGASTVEGHVYKCELLEAEDLQIDCSCGCDGRVKTGSRIADAMRREICEELGLTTCAGVSYNKTLAKIVGSQHKPNQQTTLFSWQAINLISSLKGKIIICLRSQMKPKKFISRWRQEYSRDWKTDIRHPEVTRHLLNSRPAKQ